MTSNIPEHDGVGDLQRWKHVLSDYHGALVRLATMRANKNWYLLFGYVELFPHDIPVPRPFCSGQRPWHVPGYGGDITLAASANQLLVADALTWYEDAAEDHVTIPNSSSTLIASSFSPEPTLGEFCIGNEIPFAAPWHDRPRVHRLVPMSSPSDDIVRLSENEDAKSWLKENIGFDPFQFEEWLGSISLIAPDPLFSDVWLKILEQKPNGSEKILLQAHRRKFETYPEDDVNKVSVITLHERPSGWKNVSPSSFDSDGILILDMPGPAWKVGYAISCPTRGLLRMLPPSPFFREINTAIDITNTTWDVSVPSGGRRKPESSYRTNRITHSSVVQVGGRFPISGATRLLQLQGAKEERLRIASAPQKLLGEREPLFTELTAPKRQQMRKDAEEYVGNLVAKANRRVIFVDPHFCLRELFNFALRPRREGVKVIIVTGLICQNEMPPGLFSEDTPETTPTEDKPYVEMDKFYPGYRIKKELDRLRPQLGQGTPDVFIMPGGKDRLLFHDRFLVIDDSVWFCGPSFNELGERIGLISQAHESSAIIKVIETVLDQRFSLEEWLKQDSNQSKIDNDATKT